jgi:uroporphyrinogen decarboxylase
MIKLNNKELIIQSIEHRNISRIPMMYRADPAVNLRLIEYFKLGSIESGWQELIKKLGADNFSDGATLSGFTTYFPKYIGPDFNITYESNHFFIWGIKPIPMKVGDTIDIVFHKNPPLYDKDELCDIADYGFPRMDWFDFNTFKIVSEAVFQDFNSQKEVSVRNLKRSEELFLSAYFMNCIFMVSIFIRGINKMLMDLVSNKRYAEKLIANIGEFMVEFCSNYLAAIGDKLDMYGIWDDFATQLDLVISPELWRRYYKPWYKKIVEIAKKYNLFICFHVCGNCSAVIPDLIEIGVDILDPVQVNAKNMEICKLKKLYGKDICFHGGLDAQNLIPLGTPSEIIKEVKRVKNFFRGEGGIILGPSHFITPDTPIENILAIYQ